MSREQETGLLLDDNSIDNVPRKDVDPQQSFLNDLETSLTDIAEDPFVEVPQGRHLGVFSTMVLFVARIVGSGIFATPSSIYVNCGGNTGIYFGVWTLAGLVSFAGLFVFLEYGSWLPRSGGRKNFLEQTYTRPELMMSVTFVCFTIFTGFAMSNAIVFGKYFLYVLGFSDPSTGVQSNASKYVSIIVISVAMLVHGCSVRTGVRIQNFLGGIKFGLIGLMCLIGLYSFFYHVPEGKESPSLKSNSVFAFQNKSEVSLASLASAFLNAFFCFSGWDSVHSVASEVKNPTYTLKVGGTASLLICFTCYSMMNLAYVNVLSYEEIKQAGPLVGSVLFTKLFGKFLGSKLLSLSVAVSTLSNLLVVIYGLSRMNQESFREGYLPFSKQLASNWPWGSPLPSILVCGGFTIIWLAALPPENSSFDYLVSMEGYGNQFFLLLIAVGLFIHRRRHKGQQPSTRASTLGTILMIIVSGYTLITPFIGDQNRNMIGFLPPYQITSILIIGACFFFWLVTFVILPRTFHYELEPNISYLADGLAVTEWKKKII
ncbi:ZYRO0G07590p [Zygosaccharomyces rouxii]|uniref:ZYRO0G07590p n=1 Tax=Zygosaccharomyces rouxii (strain ATCC 2623 / CBS 732 / NBRC 1130 / NCYC 568 / NRRL Y-229) TaxID=559307 RepID=C5DZV8_ZYGRC|nr:uncharacterized protein ZYRO0G07590g [Zygosaccharomyces rouxii]KAH9202389.1 amino acid/polyamine transporter I [Zygosaccharomyces rouxii]CAR29392.1 ZYRO0G07590p [Zygosaccharomyces rouxii]